MSMPATTTPATTTTATTTTPTKRSPVFIVIGGVVLLIVLAIVMFGDGCGGGNKSNKNGVEIVVYEREVENGKIKQTEITRGFARKNSPFTYYVKDSTPLRFESDGAVEVLYPTQNDPNSHFSNTYCGAGPMSPSQTVGFGTIYFKKIKPCK